MYMSIWQEYYHDYKLLENSWKWNNAPYELKNQAFRQIFSPKDPNFIIDEMNQWGWGLPDYEQWEKALKLRNVLIDLPSGWFKDEPLEDVYQAALRMELYVTWRTHSNMSKIFRGQRRYEWTIIPNLF
jgi:hypothetical protein